MWQKHSIDFNIGISTLEKMVHRVIKTIRPVIHARLVKPAIKSGHMEYTNTFVNYLHHPFAAGVKFQTGYRPSVRITG